MEEDVAVAREMLVDFRALNHKFSEQIEDDYEIEKHDVIKQNRQLQLTRGPPNLRQLADVEDYEREQEYERTGKVGILAELVLPTEVHDHLPHASG